MVASQFAQQADDLDFTAAVQSLADSLGLIIKDEPMPISKFKSDYGGLLRGALDGRLQQISRGRERYVVLSEAQVISMVQSRAHRSSLADTLASVKAPPGPLDTSAVMVESAALDPFSLPSLES